VLDRDVHNRLSSSPLPAALAIVLGLEPLRGYNPMDILRYKEFLLFIAGRDNLPPPENGVGYFPIKNKTLLDLLGTRFLMEPSDPRMRPKEEEAGAAQDPRWRKVFEDPNPRAYLFVAGGIRDLPAYSVYENPEAFPRAFVVPRAEPLPERSRVLRAFERSDFRRVVFLEGPDGGPPAGTPAGSFRPATIREYRPNRVAVGVGGESPGYLVLMDPWFPGWSCTLDGRPAKLRRANYAFRAVAVPAGDHEVVFTFAPASYALGRMISGGSLAAVAGIGLLAAAVRSRGRPAAIDEDPATVGTDPATSSHPPESA
jgi:hypothetical protein